MVHRLGHYDGTRKKTGSISDVDMEKDGACKMERQNKKLNFARKSGRRKNNAGTDKEEKKKLAGHWLRRNCLLKDAVENDKRKESSRQKKISDDSQHYDKWTVCKYEKECRE